MLIFGIEMTQIRSRAIMNNRSNYTPVNSELKKNPEIEDNSTTTQSNAAQISSSSNNGVKDTEIKNPKWNRNS